MFSATHSGSESSVASVPILTGIAGAAAGVADVSPVAGCDVPAGLALQPDSSATPSSAASAKAHADERVERAMR